MSKVRRGKQLYSTGSSAPCSGIPQNGRMGKGLWGREAQEEGDICIIHSHCFTAENNTQIQVYSNLKYRKPLFMRKKKTPKNRIVIWPSNPTNVYTPRENRNPERHALTTTFTAALFTTARTWKPPKCPSTDRWLGRCGRLYNGVLLSPKGRKLGNLEFDVDGPRVCHREWSNSEIKYPIFTHVWNLKNDTDELTYRSWMDVLKWRTSHGHVERDRHAQLRRAALSHTVTRVGGCCTALQLTALWWPKGMSRRGGSGKNAQGRVYMYTYTWFTLWDSKK